MKKGDITTSSVPGIRSIKDVEREGRMDRKDRTLNCAFPSNILSPLSPLLNIHLTGLDNYII